METIKVEGFYPLANFQKESVLVQAKHLNKVVTAYYQFDTNIDFSRLLSAIALLPQCCPLLSAGLRENGAEIGVQVGTLGELSSKVIEMPAFEGALPVAMQCLEQELSVGFPDFSQQLIQSKILHFATGQCWWILQCHPLMSDALGMDSVYRLLARIYQALEREDTAALSSITMAQHSSVSDSFAYFLSPSYQTDGDYWRAEMKRDKAALNFCKRNTIQPPVKQSSCFTVEGSNWDQVRALSGELGVEPASILIAALAVYLRRYSGTDNVSIGWHAANPSCNDILALNIDLAAADSVAEVVADVAETLEAHSQHARFPQRHLIDLAQAHQVNVQQMFDLSFSVQELGSNPLGAQRFNTLSASNPPQLSVRAEQNGQMQLYFDYSSADLDTNHADNLLEGIACTISSMLSHPSQTPIEKLATVSPALHERFLGAWGGTNDVGIPRCCFHEIFEKQVQLHPDSSAIVYGETSLTYAQLNARANLLAQQLRQQGMGVGALVGIFCERSLEMMVAILAILKAGGAFVPLDIEYPENRLHYILDDAELMYVVSQQHLRAKLPEYIQPCTLWLDEIDWSKSEGVQNTSVASLGLTPNHLAYVIYTSGTTGQPKGVLIEHAGLSNLAYALTKEFQLGLHSHVLQFASIVFDAMISEIVMAFTTGACLYIASQAERISPDALGNLLSRGKITHAILPPVLLKYLSTEKLSSVTDIVLVGESTPLETAKFWAQGRRLYNGYGPTECTVCISQSTFDGTSMHIGRPLANVHCYVLDANEQLLPIGAPGTLYAGGVGIARGYLNKPEMTQSKFSADKFSGSGRLYNTGDIVRWLPDGNLDFVGRQDQQVKIRGLRIELEDVEAHIESISGVSQVVVLAKEMAVDLSDFGADTSSTALSHTEKFLVAYVVASSPRLNAIAIRKSLSRLVPTFMVPAYFVFLEQFPLTHNRKIDKKKLLEMPLEMRRV